MKGKRAGKWEIKGKKEWTGGGGRAEGNGTGQEERAANILAISLRRRFTLLYEWTIQCGAQQQCPMTKSGSAMSVPGSSVYRIQEIRHCFLDVFDVTRSWISAQRTFATLLLTTRLVGHSATHLCMTLMINSIPSISISVGLLHIIAMHKAYGLCRLTLINRIQRNMYVGLRLTIHCVP